MASLVVGFDFHETKAYVGLWNETKNMPESFFVPGISENEQDGGFAVNYPKEIMENDDVLTGFLNEILSSIRNSFAGAKIAKIGITYGDISEDSAKKIKNAFLNLNFKEEELFLSNHANAFLSAMLFNGQSASPERTAVIDIGKDTVNSYYYGPSDLRNGLPATIERIDLKNMNGMLFDAESKSECLNAFSDTVYNVINFKKKITCLYVTGEMSEDDGFKNVLRHFASASLKIYVGQNLYSDGICSMAKFDKPQKDIVYDGEIFYDVTVTAYEDFELRDIKVIHAGMELNDAKGEICLISDDTDELKIKIFDLRTGYILNVIVSTESVLNGENKTNRLLVDLMFTDIRTLAIKVRNLGFGEINPSNYKVFEQTVVLKG